MSALTKSQVFACTAHVLPGLVARANPDAIPLALYLLLDHHRVRAVWEHGASHDPYALAWGDGIVPGLAGQGGGHYL